MEQAFVRTGTTADRLHESNPQTQASIVEDDGDENVIIEEYEDDSLPDLLALVFFWLNHVLDTGLGFDNFNGLGSFVLRQFGRYNA
ncbi:hypothetical protein C2845_PM06G25390 [Panicum miliaceum]|uniref:Uncharacterized protein n=1 Tax=Panicum miliaceum TaxID=4540 RepID=A0A3L6R683_PANMI|nr:hypothetical protein C2845_PM06G25390 [Panicum miliaceum]